jgi:hypothetical protein
MSTAPLSASEIDFSQGEAAVAIAIDRFVERLDLLLRRADHQHVALELLRQLARVALAEELQLVLVLFEPAARVFELRLEELVGVGGERLPGVAFSSMNIPARRSATIIAVRGEPT